MRFTCLNYSFNVLILWNHNLEFIQLILPYLFSSDFDSDLCFEFWFGFRVPLTITIINIFTILCSSLVCYSTGLLLFHSIYCLTPLHIMPEPLYGFPGLLNSWSSIDSLISISVCIAGTHTHTHIYLLTFFTAWSSVVFVLNIYIYCSLHAYLTWVHNTL